MRVVCMKCITSLSCFSRATSASVAPAGAAVGVGVATVAGAVGAVAPPAVAAPGAGGGAGAGAAVEEQEIIVKSMDGNTITVNMSGDATIKDLRKSIDGRDGKLVDFFKFGDEDPLPNELELTKLEAAPLFMLVSDDLSTLKEMGLSESEIYRLTPQKRAEFKEEFDGFKVDLESDTPTDELAIICKAKMDRWGTKLDLSFNKDLTTAKLCALLDFMKTTYPGIFNNFTELSLRGCGALEGVPVSIGGLTNLTQLILSDCTNLKELPDSIGGLTNLQELDLRDRDITELPDSIGGLTNLRHLYLGETGITPENIAEIQAQLPNCVIFT